MVSFDFLRVHHIRLTAEGAETAKREIYLNYNQVVFGQQLTEQVTLRGILD